MPIDTLTHDPKNARKHNNVNRMNVRNSLRRFGQRLPIVVQSEGMVIRVGNNRTDQARELGWTHIAAVLVDEGDAEAMAFALADNRSAEDGATWDIEVLGNNMTELSSMLDSMDNGKAELPFQMEDLGWVGDDLDALVGAMGDVPEIAPPPPPIATDDPVDVVPELPVEPTTQKGEVLQLGVHTLHCGDCLEHMATIADDSIDAIVTDPPYGIGFLGKDWDVSVPGDKFASEALRILKPGGHIVAFAATTTYDVLAGNLRTAGFEIRDMISWIQWQGFPKNLDVSKAIDKDASTDEAKLWAGWGTALKPSQEPAVLARKPLEKGLTVAANVLRYGTGALNIDACRIAFGDPAWPGPERGLEEIRAIAGPNVRAGTTQDASTSTSWNVDKTGTGPAGNVLGRWPANIFHCTKPARSEKELGCDDLPHVSAGAATGGRAEGSAGLSSPRAGAGRTSGAKNSHPTVKPVKLMRWLLHLVSPPGAVVLEPFAGSGSTLVAAMGLDLSIVAVEQDPGYCDIIKARVLADVPVDA